MEKKATEERVLKYVSSVHPDDEHLHRVRITEQSHRGNDFAEYDGFDRVFIRRMSKDGEYWGLYSEPESDYLASVPGFVHQSEFEFVDKTVPYTYITVRGGDKDADHNVFTLDDATFEAWKKLVEEYNYFFAPKTLGGLFKKHFGRKNNPADKPKSVLTTQTPNKIGTIPPKAVLKNVKDMTGSTVEVSDPYDILDLRKEDYGYICVGFKQSEKKNKNHVRIEIPKGVVSIQPNAFVDEHFIHSVKFNGVRWIGEAAFSGCRSLQKLDGLETVENIGKSAFAQCGMSTFSIPKNVENIRDHTFYGCFRLQNIDIHPSVKSIGLGAFAGCTALDNVNLPDFITHISSGSFANCTSLTNISISEKVTSIGDISLRGGQQAIRHGIYVGFTPTPDDRVYSGAFQGCSKLKTVKMRGTQGFILKQKGVKIDQNTFIGCVSLPLRFFYGDELKYKKVTDRSIFPQVAMKLHDLIEKGETAEKTEVADAVELLRMFYDK